MLTCSIADLLGSWCEVQTARAAGGVPGTASACANSQYEHMHQLIRNAQSTTGQRTWHSLRQRWEQNLGSSGGQRRGERHKGSACRQMAKQAAVALCFSGVYDGSAVEARSGHATLSVSRKSGAVQLAGAHHRGWAVCADLYKSPTEKCVVLTVTPQGIFNPR